MRTAAHLHAANLRRTAQAATATCDRIRALLRTADATAPPQLLAVGRLRLAHPSASLAQLGALADPPLTKDAVAGRIRRLLELADRTATAVTATAVTATPQRPGG